MLHTFIAALVLLSVSDLLSGQVGPARLAGHGFLVAGYLITVALARPVLDPGGPPARHGDGRRRVTFPSKEPAPPPGPRVVPGDSPPGQPGDHRVAAA